MKYNEEKYNQWSSIYVTMKFHLKDTVIFTLEFSGATTDTLSVWLTALNCNGAGIEL